MFKVIALSLILPLLTLGPLGALGCSASAAELEQNLQVAGEFLETLVDAGFEGRASIRTKDSEAYLKEGVGLSLPVSLEIDVTLVPSRQRVPYPPQE